MVGQRRSHTLSRSDLINEAYQKLPAHASNAAQTRRTTSQNVYFTPGAVRSDPFLGVRRAELGLGSR